MRHLRHVITLGLVFVLVCIFSTVSSNAAVTYEFMVTEQPAENFHKPLVATLRLSDAAVASGQATQVDIESLSIAGGTAVRDENPLNLSHVHPAFTNWVITLSEDRNTVVTISAIVAPHNSPIDHLVFYQQDPSHPTLEVHENLGYVGSEYITLETTLLPVPPEYHTSTFVGEWERMPVHGVLVFLDRLREMLACFPFCPLPWALIILAIILPMLAGLIYRKRTANRK